MQDNYIENIQEVKLKDRKVIELTGVNKISKFTKEDFWMDTKLGSINLKGSELEIIKLNTEDGNVKIKGKINSIIYYDSKKQKNNESIWAKLFK